MNSGSPEDCEGIIFLSTSPLGASILVISGMSLRFDKRRTSFAFFATSTTVDENPVRGYNNRRTYLNGKDFKADGNFRVKETDIGIDVEGECSIADIGKLSIKNGVGRKTKEFRYPPKEAGLRAKNLTAETVSEIKAHDVISYSIYGNIRSLFEDCGEFLRERFPKLDGPAPGAIMVGTDAKHCAIMDNEGSKFTHSNPHKKVVTTDSIIMSRVYFPNGVIYKGYPDDWPF